ncbi:MAG: mycofactocin biosynthesis peptidyl-dipeptidase MftE [Actinomycetes bacterium]
MSWHECQFVHSPNVRDDGTASAPGWQATMTQFRIGEATSPEIANRDAMLLVPIGSTEQHGPHLPLNTDTNIAVAIAERAAELLLTRSVDALIAPALPFGSSGEHAGFAGTLSIGNEVLESVVVELVRSASEHFSSVVIVNGHGGNQAALVRAVAALRSEGRDALVWSPIVPGGDSHAGRTETSMMLAIDARSVRLDRAERGVMTPLRDVIDELREGGLIAVTPNGVLGDPAGASPEEGQRLLAECAENLVAAILANRVSTTAHSTRDSLGTYRPETGALHSERAASDWTIDLE